MLEYELYVKRATRWSKEDVLHVHLITVEIGIVGWRNR